MKTIYDFIDIGLHNSRIWDTYFRDLKIGVFDIETTGLNSLYSQVILGGVLEYKSGASYRQFFAESKEDEPVLLKAYLESLSHFDVLVSYNGENFDLPFLRDRLVKHGISYDFSRHWSLDLYKIINKHSGLRKALPDLKQKTIEKYLGISDDRKDEISGGESVELYKDYLKNPREDVAARILLHNKDDLGQLASIIPIADKLDLHKIFFSEGFATSFESSRFINREIKIKKGQIEVKAAGINIPSDFYAFKPSHHGVFREGELFLTLPLERVKDAFVFDLLLLPVDYSALEKYPAFEQDYLIIQDGEQVNYKEINQLIMLVEGQLLREFA